MSDYLSRLVDRSLDRTEVIKPRLASFFEPSVQGEPVFGEESGSERLVVSSTSDETVQDNLQSAWRSDQTPQQTLQLKSAALQPAWSGSQQTPCQPRLGMTRQASSLSPSAASSVLPEVTAQSSGVFVPSNTASPAARSSGGKTPQQKSSQDLPAPSDGDETYVASPGAAAERSRASAHEPAIQPITIESSPPTSPEVTAQQSAVRMVQQESDHEMLTPPSSGDGETYQSPRVTAERNRESTREPAIQPISIEQIVPPANTQPRASEPAEPAVIRVTIGRIEVRATTPPLPPAPRTRPPGPALTLDDYLKQRNGGQL